MSTGLGERYGRTRTRTRRDRVILWSVGAAFVVVFAAWVVWAGLDGSKASIETRDLGYTVVDDHAVSVAFEVSAPTGTPLSCAVQALNTDFTIVGWKVVDLPPSTDYTRTFSETVRTSGRSESGLIYRCWLT
ncbi:DUF4307 domain-containing protein [Cryobacterium tepidiphilum]|uniref:DUF4307 domain-containing protein n=2 Tax=Cryobacterium tepidiphilum TaxID=2486026 RepID=A0A3M8LH28_9MICO|nr:DUF4307 domain-containing protein [Cryobacterium tepidiphilum]